MRSIDWYWVQTLALICLIMIIRFVVTPVNMPTSILNRNDAVRIARHCFDTETMLVCYGMFTGTGDARLEINSPNVNPQGFYCSLYGGDVRAASITGFYGGDVRAVFITGFT